jgi:tetratricopeptide (TPR) repeat protein
MQAIQEAPSAKAYEARAKAHIQLENYVEAAEDAGKAIELDPSFAAGYLRKG